ncbi:MAG: hypothetical protein ACRD2L_04230, partial [Terriglobia bacterium]
MLARAAPVEYITQLISRARTGSPHPRPDLPEGAHVRALVLGANLEVFVNKNFSLYEDEHLPEFSSKLTEAMRERGILSRFVAISGSLCSEDA